VTLPLNLVQVLLCKACKLLLCVIASHFEGLCVDAQAYGFQERPGRPISAVRQAACCFLATVTRICGSRINKTRVDDWVRASRR
jgi:hypothetical protein